MLSLQLFYSYIPDFTFELLSLKRLLVKEPELNPFF